MRRAEAMRQVLREHQADCEKNGNVSEEINRRFIEAGFYRILQPRRFGGYEFDLKVFLEVMIAIARGCSESGWVLALTAGHAAILALFSEDAQREAFGSSGEFRAPGVAMPGGVAISAEGGYWVKGAWDYASGIDLATHFFGAVVIQNAGGGAPAGGGWLLLEHSECRIENNWNVMGMQGTGSKRVVLGERLVPAHRVLMTSDSHWTDLRDQPGRALHPNPLYHGRLPVLLISEVAAVSIGAARGALDVYEEMLRNKRQYFPPFPPRFEAEEFQHHFGLAQSMIDTAESALLRLGEQYVDLARREFEQGIPFDEEMERRLILVEQQCVRLAWEATELLFRTAGTSASAKEGAMLGRFFRNLAVIRTHITLQHDRTAVTAARLRFGLSALSRI